MKTSFAKNSAASARFMTIAFLWLASLPLAAASFNSDLHKSFTSKQGGKLLVDAESGDVDVKTGTRDEVVFEVKRKITGGSEAKAKEIFDAHEVTFDQDGDLVRMHAKFKKDSQPWFRRGGLNFEVQFSVTVPAKYNLDISTGAGSISVADIEGEVKSRSGGGDLKFASIKGPLDANTSAGSIRLQAASGPAQVKTAGGDIWLDQLDSDSSAETAAGTITVKTAKAKLNCKSNGGDLKLGSLSGPTEAQTAAGSIAVSSAATTFNCKSGGGDLRLGTLSGPAQVHTAAGSIKVQQALAKLDAKTSGGDVNIANASATVNAHTAAGSIFAAFSAQPKDDCSLTSAGGDINIRLAQELAFDVRAKTGGGDVTTDIPVAANVVGKNNQNGLNGKINGGGKALVLETAAGSIMIKKLKQ